MRRFSWLVGSLLALTVVVAMNADQGLTGLADTLRDMHLSSATESVEPSFSRPSTTPDSAAVPYRPKHAAGKATAATHPDTAVDAKIQASLQAVKVSLENLDRTAQNTIVLGNGALEKIEGLISFTFRRKFRPNAWNAKNVEWMQNAMPTAILRGVEAVKAFEDLLTQLAKLWALKPELTNGLEGIQQLFNDISPDHLLKLYRVAEDLEALALLWTRKSMVFNWPQTEQQAPVLDRWFTDGNDANLVALSRAIRDQISTIIGPQYKRTKALQRFIPSHWSGETSLVNAFDKRMMDLETLHFSWFLYGESSEDLSIAHYKLAKKRMKLTMQASGSISPPLAPAELHRFKRLLERITNYEAQTGHHTSADHVFIPPPQLDQAPPDGWIAVQGYAQPGVDGTGHHVLNAQVQQAAIVPNYQARYGSTNAFAQPQPAGYYGGYYVGYPGGHQGGFPGGYNGG